GAGVVIDQQHVFHLDSLFLERTSGLGAQAILRRVTSIDGAQAVPSALASWCATWVEPSSLGRERQMGDARGRRDRLDVVCLLQRLQAVPEPDTAAEDDRDLYQVHVVDQPLREEVAYHGGAAAEAHVLAVGRLASLVERL